MILESDGCAREGPSETEPGAMPALAGASICRKQFGSTVALDGVGFGVEPGTVHALARRERRRQIDHRQVPERADPARRRRDPRLRRTRHYRQAAGSAHGLGIRTAFQEISLVKDLTVAQNFLADGGAARPPRPRSRRRHRKHRRRGDCSGSAFSGINPRAKVGRPRSADAAEDRDRPQRQPQSAAPSPRRADLISFEPGRAVAGEPD